MKHIHLSRGQTLGMRVEPGTLLCTVRGTVTLSTEPRWLAETVWRARVAIHPAQTHAVEAGGWVTLCTDDVEAELRCLPAQAAASRRPLANALLALARRAFA